MIFKRKVKPTNKSFRAFRMRFFIRMNDDYKDDDKDDDVYKWEFGILNTFVMVRFDWKEFRLVAEFTQLADCEAIHKSCIVKRKRKK